MVNPRTQNTVEAWHCQWNTLIGRAHVGIYTIIEEMHKEQQQTNIQIENIICGEPQPSQHNCDSNCENRILTVFGNCNDYLLVDYLRGIAHNISL